MDTNVVLITGAGRGIGKALAIGLSRAGYTVVATARETTDLDQLDSRLTSEHLLERCDITSYEDCQSVVKAAVEKYGRIDVLINNAGGKYVKTSLLESAKEDIDSVFDTQVKGTAYMIKCVLEQMAKQKSGRIYTITYAPYRLGLHLLDQKTLHSASLFGKAALADVVALEAKNYGVHSIPVFISNVASRVDIDDPVDPAEKSNSLSEVVDTILSDINSGKETKEIFVTPSSQRQ